MSNAINKDRNRVISIPLAPDNQHGYIRLLVVTKKDNSMSQIPCKDVLVWRLDFTQPFFEFFSQCLVVG